MSSEQKDIQVLESAIMEEAREEVSQVLNQARARADSIHQQVSAQTDAEREAILQQAREKAHTLREHAAAAAQMESQALKLERREQLLDRVFTAARQQLPSVAQWPDYDQIKRHLVREAVEQMGADEVLVRADAETLREMNEEMLADLERELGVRLRIGKPLTQSTGIILETPDGHRRYDNTLETRLTRMRKGLRTPVYHILMGETL